MNTMLSEYTSQTSLYYSTTLRIEFYKFYKNDKTQDYAYIRNYQKLQLTSRIMAYLEMFVEANDISFPKLKCKLLRLFLFLLYIFF